MTSEWGIVNILYTNRAFGVAMFIYVHVFFYISLTLVLLWCSSSEWNEIDPSEREDLHLKMEDGEFW